MAGPEGLKSWGPGAAGTRAPELIGNPSDNEGWKACGLIGPGSGQAFVWGKAQSVGCRIPTSRTWPCSWGPAEHWGGIPGGGCVRPKAR